MEKEKFIEYCSLYFLNGLDEKELKEFKSALESGNEEFKKIYSDFEKTSLHLSLATEQTEPPSYIKKQILTKIHGVHFQKKPRLVEKIAGSLGFLNPRFALGIVSVFFLGLIVLSFLIYQKQGTINSQNNTIVQLKDEVQRNKEMLKILAAKKVNIILMNGLEVNPAGYGKMVVDPAKKLAILQVANLPATPSNKDYELWVIKDKKPINNGVFAISKEKENNYFMITGIRVQDMNNINAFAITLEPKGGVPQPTGKMYLLGQTNL
jgi:Anti-sigma-K factor rskA, C-terminal